MQTPPILADGKKSPYGLGLWIGEDRGIPTVEHGGGDPGYRAYVARYPEQKLAIAVLCNLDDIDTAALTRKIASAYLTDAFRTPSPTDTASPVAASLSAAQLDAKVGLYHDAEHETFGRIVIRKGKLIATDVDGNGGHELTPIDANHFIVQGTPVRVEFISSPAGTVQERVHVGAARPIVMDKVQAIAVSRVDVASYGGRYTSADLDVTYALVPRSSSLVIQSPGRPEIRLESLLPDYFHGPLIEVVKFSRDARGVVTGFSMYAPGVRGLPFRRVGEKNYLSDRTRRPGRHRPNRLHSRRRRTGSCRCCSAHQCLRLPMPRP
jgi:hypothetical protein